MNGFLRAALALGLLLAATGAVFASGDYDDTGLVLGSGNLRTEHRDVPRFDRVELEGSGNLVIRQGMPGPVAVESDDNILPLVEIEVVDGVLHLGLRPGAHVGRITRLEFAVSSPEVSAITVSGSGNARAEGGLHGDSLALDVRGSGSISCEAVDVGTFRAAIGGSGGISAQGRAADVDVTITGSGLVRARDLHARAAEVRISGSGDALVYASDTLAVTLSGSGSVRYGGGPRVTVRSSGSGTTSPF